MSCKDSFFKGRCITVPTLFTIMRLVCVPIIVAAMIKQRWGMAFWLFVFASLTDILDGVIARFLDQRSFLGACLDAVADKLLIVSCFLTLAFVQSPLFHIPQWFVFFVLIKEVILIGGALYVWFRKGFLKVKPTILGKMAMFIQVIFVIWLFSCYFFKWLPIKTYYTMLGLLLAIVLATLIHYSIIGYRYLLGIE